MDIFHGTDEKQDPNLKLFAFVWHLLQQGIYSSFSFYFCFPGTLKTLLGLVAPDKSVKEICQKGDDLLLEETSKVSH